MKLLGVVLCGGASVRMGTDKATLVDDQGQDYLSVAVARLEQVCAEVAVSAKADRQTDHRLIADPAESFGPITGVTRSLAVAAREGFHGCLFTPVDTPRLNVDDLLRLVEVFEQDQAITCAATSADAKWEPLIAIYPVACQSSLEQSVDAGEYSLQRYLACQSVRRVVLPAEACHNINTPEDLGPHSS